MCFTQDGFWGRNRKNKAREDKHPQRSTSPSPRIVVRTPDNQSIKTDTPSLADPRRPWTAASMDSTNPAKSNPTTPKSPYRGNRSEHGDSGVGMSLPPSPVEERHTYHTAVPALRVPNPRFTAMSGPASPTQWSLFPKEDTPRVPTNYSRPVTAGSQRHLTRMASTAAEANLSLRNFSPTAVQVNTSPSYARSEIASIHMHRLTRPFSYQSEAFDVPPSPPPKSDLNPTIYSSPDIPPVPPLKPQNTPSPSRVEPPRPVSFRTFVAQSKGRSQVPYHSNSSESTLSTIQPPRSVVTGTSTPNRASRNAGPPPVTKHRASRRTSLKSFLGRNGYSDEGIFVATSDDPDEPFTMFRWPNPSQSANCTPRSSTMVGR